MKSGYWNVSSFKVTYTNESMGGEVFTQLDPTFVAPTPLNFSFHCYEPEPVMPSNTSTHDISIVFSNLQVGYCKVCVEVFMASPYLV